MCEFLVIASTSAGWPLPYGDDEGGQQPIVGSDGRYRLVYNGEIYNFRELRVELEGKG